LLLITRPGAWATIRRHRVFDVDSIGLTNLVARSRGCDSAGSQLAATDFISACPEPAAPNIDEELRRFEYKLERRRIRGDAAFRSGGFEQVLKRLEVEAAVVAGCFRSKARESRVHGQRGCRSARAEVLLDRMRAPTAGGRRSRGIAIAPNCGQLRARFRVSRFRPGRATSTRRWPYYGLR